MNNFALNSQKCVGEIIITGKEMFLTIVALCLNQFSRRSTNFWIGLSITEGLEEGFCFLWNLCSPTCTLTQRIKPSLSWTASTTCPNCQWFLGRLSSLMMTMTLRLRRGKCHFCLVDMLSKYSFFQRPQNCSIRYWTLLHLFVAYTSSFTNTPGGGRATFDFIIMR